MAEEFDAASVFDDDFSYFYADRLAASRSDAEAEVLDRLCGPFSGLRVLDLCCGEGRLASRLSARGAHVVGLDASTAYLETARRSSTPVLVVTGDARRLPFRALFDLVVCWYTSFGYFDDEANRGVLSEIRRALLPGGRLLLDLDGKECLLRSGLPLQLRQRGDDVMVETFRFDPESARVVARRIVVRGEEVRQVHYFVRLFSPEEITGWLLEGGFEEIALSDERGEPFEAGSRRMLVSARRPFEHLM